MAETADYEKLLADLEEERANLDSMIAFIKRKIGLPNGQGTVQADAAPAPRQKHTITLGELAMGGPVFKPDTFFKMSVPEAIRTYLNLMKRPKSARDITDALLSGGFSHKAKDLYQTVFPTLMRMKEKGEVDKLANGEWGLSEWYRREPKIAERGEGS